MYFLLLKTPFLPFQFIHAILKPGIKDENTDGDGEGGGERQWKRPPRSKYGRNNHPRKVLEWEGPVGSLRGGSQEMDIILGVMLF